MNKTQKSIFAVTLLAFAGQVLASQTNKSTGCSTTSLYSPRSQGVNAARDMVGWEELINLPDKECFYGAVAVTLDYAQTFRGKNICECLFGNLSQTTPATTQTSCPTDCDDECSDCSIVISGSCVANRGANDWMADNFGLPTDFKSTVSFSPRVQNFVADIQFYVGLNEWVENLWFRFDLPIAHTKWSLRAQEVSGTTAALTGTYLPGYFAPNAVTSTNLLSTATEFFAGKVPTLPNDVVFQPLQYGKWACDSLKKTALADVSMVLGYNFVNTDCGFFGLSLRATAPTGNRPEGEFLFEPIVGNGHHWTLGAGMNAHYVFWRSECNDSSFSMYLDANIQHLFKACQTRSFDLCANGTNSRYMLAQKLVATPTPNPIVAGALYGNTTSGATGTVANSTASNFQFTNEFAPVANLTGSTVDVKVSVEADIAFKLAYLSDCGLTVDLGYNFWGRACEKITPTKCSQKDLSVWALKGDAYVYGFNSVGGASVALGATQSKATINGGTGAVTTTPSCNNALNTGIDNSQFASVVSTANTANTVAVESTGLTTQTNTSIQPVTLDKSALNYSANKGISNKVFTNLSYTWKECEDWLPYLGVGASAEFGQKCSSSCGDDTSCGSSSTSSCNTGCDDDLDRSCVSCALNQWSVWIKGGIAFN